MIKFVISYTYCVVLHINLVRLFIMYKYELTINKILRVSIAYTEEVHPLRIQNKLTRGKNHCFEGFWDG